MDLRLALDASPARAALLRLTEIAERLSEVGDGLLSLVESGEQLFRLDPDGLTTADAGELIIRLYPSDSLAVLLAASRARDRNFLVVEHSPSSVDVQAMKSQPGGIDNGKAQRRRQS